MAVFVVLVVVVLFVCLFVCLFFLFYNFCSDLARYVVLVELLD